MKNNILRKREYRLSCSNCHGSNTVNFCIDVNDSGSLSTKCVCLQQVGSDFFQTKYLVKYVLVGNSFDRFCLIINNKVNIATFDKQKNMIFVNGRSYSVQSNSVDATYLVSKGAALALSKNDNNVKSPLAGRIVRVAVSVGDVVHLGQVLVVIESMKMENEICSSINGIIKTLFITPGNLVQPNQMLVEIEVKGGLYGESEKTDDEAPVQNW